MAAATLSSSGTEVLQVRALTRVASRDNEDCLLVFALRSTATWSTRQADAFVNLLGDYLSDDNSGAHGDDNYLVTVHVDQSALAGGERRSAVPIESLKRLCCDSQVLVITEDDKGEPLSIGRKCRIVDFPQYV